MKRIFLKSVVSTLLATTILTSCSNKNDDNINQEQNDNTSEPKTYWDKPVCEIDDNGDTTKITEYDEKLNVIKEDFRDYVYEYEYDPATNIRTSHSRNGVNIYTATIDGLVETIIGLYTNYYGVNSWTYDENGKMEVFYLDNIVITYTDNTYKNEASIYMHDNDSLIWTIENTYKEGRLAVSTTKCKGQLLYKTSYTYSDRNIEISKLTYYTKYASGIIEECVEGQQLLKWDSYKTFLDDNYQYCLIEGYYGDDGARKVEIENKYDDQLRLISKDINTGESYKYEYFDNYKIETYTYEDYNTETEKWDLVKTKVTTTYYLVR